MTHQSKRNTISGIRNRDGLTFTGYEPGTGQFINWCPPRYPDVLDQWNREADHGRDLAHELRSLAANDEHAAISAIRHAVNSPTWNPSYGAESGFADVIARYAVAGMKAENDESADD